MTVGFRWRKRIRLGKGHWRLTLARERRARVSEQLKALFIDRAQKELQGFLPYSVAVQEVEPGIERLQWYIPARVEDNIATARKVRATFDKLRALAAAEENISIIVSESWL